MTSFDQWLTLGLSVVATAMASAALFIAYTWKVLVEDVATRVERIEAGIRQEVRDRHVAQRAGHADVVP